MHIASKKKAPRVRGLCEVRASNGLGIDIHLDSEHFYRLITEVRMSDDFDFKSVIRHHNSALGIIALWIAAGDDQPVIIAAYKTPLPIRINQAVLFWFLAALHCVEVLTFDCEL